MKKKFRVVIDRERCKGCELCVPLCPRHLLALAPELNARGIHPVSAERPDTCIGCLKCARMCPDAAITIEGHEHA